MFNVTEEGRTLTIKDIARESGFAVSTVSRALNNHPDVSEETKRKIKEVVERHNFVLNTSAQQLKQQNTNNILVVVKGAFNPFFSSISEQIQGRIIARGYTAMTHFINENDDEVLVAQLLSLGYKPRGIIFLGGNTANFRARFQSDMVPSVLATNLLDTEMFPNLSSVGIDDSEAGMEAVNLLLQKGHRAIGVVAGDPNISEISAHRIEGCRRGFRALGHQGTPFLLETAPYNIKDGYLAMQHLLARNDSITGVFCASDMLALGAMRAIVDAGFRVPQDISVVGIDGLDLSEYYNPRLTTFCQPQEQLARETVKQLLLQIEENAPGKNIPLKATLRQGKSVSDRNTSGLR